MDDKKRKELDELFEQYITSLNNCSKTLENIQDKPTEFFKAQSACTECQFNYTSKLLEYYFEPYYTVSPR